MPGMPPEARGLEEGREYGLHVSRQCAVVGKLLFQFTLCVPTTKVGEYHVQPAMTEPLHDRLHSKPLQFHHSMRRELRHNGLQESVADV
jgi:hypothetical protein